MNIMWAMHLQKLFDEENVPITVMSLDPGMILTGMHLDLLLGDGSISCPNRWSNGDITLVHLLANSALGDFGGRRGIYFLILRHKHSRKERARLV